MIVNKKTLADIMGVSERTLTEWQDGGMPIMSVGGRGIENQYETEVVIDWRINRSLAGAKKETERERRDRLESDLLELRIAEKISGLIPADVQEGLWVGAILAARAALRGIPDKIKSDIDAKHGTNIDIAPLIAMVDEAMQKLSETTYSEEESPTVMDYEADDA